MTIKNHISYLLNINKLKKIKLIVSDIDGVMTDGRIIFDDNSCRELDLSDSDTAF